MCHVARLAALVIAATFSFHAIGCESSSVPRRASPASAAKSAAQVTQQLIIKFKPESVACTAQAIAHFSKTADVYLAWLRPMSGDACVVVQSASNPSELAKAQERLKRRPDIEWVEIDAVMQAH